MAPSNWTLFHVLKKQLIHRPPSPKPAIVVDMGSGTGETLLSLAKSVGSTVKLLGSDISAAAVHQANTKAAEMGVASQVTFICSSVEDFPWEKVPELSGCPTGQITAVNVDHVIQYLPPEIRETMMTGIAMHLQPGGILSMRTITPSGPFFEKIQAQKEAHPTLSNAFLNHGTFIQFLEPKQMDALFDSRYTTLGDFSTQLTPYQYGVGVPLHSYMRISQYLAQDSVLDPGISRPPFLRYVSETLSPQNYTAENPMRMLCVGYPEHYGVMQEISHTLHRYYGNNVTMTAGEGPKPLFPDNSFDAIYLTADHHMPQWESTTGFRANLLSGKCQENLLRMVRPGGIISANVTKPARTDSTAPSLAAIRESFFCAPEQNPCLVLTAGNVYRNQQPTGHDHVWRLATRVDRKPGNFRYTPNRTIHQSAHQAGSIPGLTMSTKPVITAPTLDALITHTTGYFESALQQSLTQEATYHGYTKQQSKPVTLHDASTTALPVQLFRDYGDHGLSAKGHDLLYFPRDRMPTPLGTLYQNILSHPDVQNALSDSHLPLTSTNLSTRLTINAYRLLDPSTGQHAGFPPHVDLSSNGKITVIVSGTTEKMSFFRLGRPAEGPLSREDIALGKERQMLSIPPGALTVIQGQALTHWAHEVLPMVRDPRQSYFSWVFGIQGR
jgi:SAM-dependent methyltransferase